MDPPVVLVCLYPLPFIILLICLLKLPGPEQLLTAIIEIDRHINEEDKPLKLSKKL